MPRVSRFWRQDRPWSFQTRCAYRLLLLIEFALTAAYLLFKLAYLLFAGGKLMPGFTIRYCEKASVITNAGFRVLFAGQIYDILTVDHQNYKRKSVKLRCRKARR